MFYTSFSLIKISFSSCALVFTLLRSLSRRNLNFTALTYIKIPMGNIMSDAMFIHFFVNGDTIVSTDRTGK